MIQLILQSTIEYNKTIHSVTNKKPIEIIHSSAPEFEAEIREKVNKAQEIQMKRLNEARRNRTFQVGEKVLLKQAVR